MDMPPWFSNLVFWSIQVALLILAAGILARALKLRQPRVLLTYWRTLLVVGLLLPLIQPWHRPPTIAATVIPADFAVPLLPPSSPAAAHWHLPSLQTLAPILGIMILAGIALRFAVLALGLLKLRSLRQTSRLVASSDEFAAVRLTNARKSYLEALLEFTNARTLLASIPAPPFLAERQLVERVSLMLKEVRMSQRRLIVSLVLISSSLALVIALAAWTFPLKAQGVAGGVPGGVAGGIAQGVSQGIAGGVAQGIANGVAGGVSNGIANGVNGGISGGISTRASAEEPSVDYSTVWLDTVKRGAMPLQVRGKGTLVHGEGSANLVARVTVPASMSADVKPGENATVGSKKGAIGAGHVSSVSQISDDTRTVDIALDAVALRTTEGLEVMANINIGKLDNVLYIGRPVNTTPNGEARLFKIINNGEEAIRTNVKLGRASANTIEVLDGLKEGDKVILSDMSSVANAERIRLTDDNHVLKH